MKQFLEKRMPRIWTRLFVLVVLAVMLTWLVVGLAMRALQDARAVMGALDTTHVPALTRTSQLAAQVSDLAILSNELLFASSISDSPIEAATDDLSQFLVARFDDPALEVDTRIMVEQLEHVARNLAEMRALERGLRENVSRLRWLSLELDEETSALVADFTFNIQAQTRNLVGEDSRTARDARATFLAEEIRNRDAYSNLASELTRLVSVALQIADAASVAQLQQLDDIFADSISSIKVILSKVPEKSEFLTIRQSVRALEEIAVGQGGLVPLRAQWIARRDRIQSQLEHTLPALLDVQRGLQRDAEAQRAALSGAIRTFSAQSDQRRLILQVSTVIALFGGLGILFLYIRPVIIRPMQHLTNAMNDIARGQLVELHEFGNRKDEIGQLSNAVRAFGSSVKDRDQAIETLKATQSALVQAGKMAALGNLSAGIGHELNQPLGAMKQRLHLLDGAIARGDSATQARQSEKITALAERMEQIILHLKKFARRSEYLQENVPLLPLIEAAAELMKNNLSERQITLTLDPALKGRAFLGDPVLVEQVVLNLLSNASDAIDETGAPGDILVELVEVEPGQIAFAVVDTGVGLGDLDPVSVVEPFVTSKDPGAGLGLGLSISYNIISGLGGDLVVAGRRGDGVRVTVILPVAEDMT